MFKDTFKFVFGAGFALFLLFVLFLAFVLIANTTGRSQQILEDSFGSNRSTPSDKDTFDADKFIAENKMVAVYVIHGSPISDGTQYLTLEKCQDEVNAIGGRCVKEMVVE